MFPPKLPMVLVGAYTAITVGLILSRTLHAQVFNGHFEFTDPGAVWQRDGAASFESGAPGEVPPASVALLQESEFGGLTRLYQCFDIPQGTTSLYFRYRFISTDTGEVTVTPPDSFTVFLMSTAAFCVPPLLALLPDPEPEIPFALAEDFVRAGEGRWFRGHPGAGDEPAWLWWPRRCRRMSTERRACDGDHYLPRS